MDKKVISIERRFKPSKNNQTKINENIIRSNVINELRKHIKDEKIITAYEKEIFKMSQKEYKNQPDFTSIKFLNIYDQQAIYLLQNLDKNSYIQSNMVIATTPEEVTINSFKLKPSKWKKYEERMEKIANEIMNATEETTDVYQCGKCKQRNCIYYISQTRSADEGFTVIIKCKTKGCNNSWREYS